MYFIIFVFCNINPPQHPFRIYAYIQILNIYALNQNDVA